MNDAIVVCGITVAVTLFSFICPITDNMGAYQRTILVFIVGMLTATVSFWAASTNDAVLRAQFDLVGWRLLFITDVVAMIAYGMLRKVYVGLPTVKGDRLTWPEKRYAWPDFRDTGHVRGRSQLLQRHLRDVSKRLKKWWSGIGKPGRRG